MAQRKDYWHLREILDLEEFKKLFRNFSVITGLDVGLFDGGGFEILVNRRENSICNAAKNCSHCRESISYGGLMSQDLGEPYICSCGCGLIMCFLPIMFKERLIGSIACGPALLWDADDVAISEFKEKTRRMELEVDVEKIFSSIISLDCINMTSAAQILYIIVNNLSSEHSAYLDQRAVITEQQAKIAELIIESKSVSAAELDKEKDPAYPSEKEKELLTFARSGSLDQSRKILNSLLGEIFLFADGKMDTIRVRLFELIAFFSRAAVETGAPLSEINHITEGAFEIFNEATDFEKLCFLTRRAMEEFITRVFKKHGQKQLSDHLTRAINFIETHYKDDLTLQRVADAIFVSAFYLSHLFRNEMDTTFSDYVCRQRINKAKDFLKSNKFMRIQEIAEKTGFNDPNYFAKSFKKLVGVTPKEYRAFF
ncbi:PocR ligand-binding domain-containing protein [Leadbettera azotonutricia]|uniref:Transcriptional regulator, AraC family n=1 Tax=Leadbettera azotonutricia (strain ATCC BAA-888 / DSM 13862 / ZAS-9) TaxID=545695 RepID=F5YBP1_LEAAZ|nr:PocR ligand-binding domain-containing protein [Leadbettera azotonutricia]AEF81850.1 transcriptional regulator, AraC family [Leadbettera azotonutricia ZAS-9]